MTHIHKWPLALRIPVGIILCAFVCIMLLIAMLVERFREKFWPCLLTLSLCVMCLISSGETVIFCGEDGTSWEEEIPQLTPDFSSPQLEASFILSPIGPQAVLVILVNFRDVPNPYTPATLYDLWMDPTTNSVDAICREQSRGLTWIVPTFVGPYDTTIDSTNSCNVNDIMYQAESQAIAHGVDYTQWGRLGFQIPLQPACGFAGTATLSSTPSWLVINGARQARVSAHEFGHVVGIHHASTDPLNSGYVSSEYGNTSSTMGFNQWGFHAVEAFNEGWMPASHCLTITNSGTYTIAAYESSAASAALPELIRFPRTTATWYYLQYRGGIGFDANIGVEHLNKVQLVNHDGSDWTNPQRTLLISELSLGQSVVVAVSGVTNTVTFTAQGSGTATVKIEEGGTVPPPPPPPAPVYPSFQPFYPVSGENPFTVIFTNTTTGTPIGWLWLFGDGTTSTAKDVTHVYTSNGVFTVELRATQYDGSLHTFRVPDLVTVTNAAPSPPPPPPVDNPPTTPINFTATDTGPRIVLTWGASTDDRGVVGYEVWKDGRFKAFTTLLKWDERDKGTHKYKVRAKDTAGQFSAFTAEVVK